MRVRNSEGTERSPVLWSGKVSKWKKAPFQGEKATAEKNHKVRKEKTAGWKDERRTGGVKGKRRSSTPQIKL